MKMKKQLKPDGRTQIHNVRFYKMKPRSIQCMAFSKQLNKLALSRNDGTIEIWDMQFAPHLERVIPSTPGGSVEGLVWSVAGQRLFSVGITGELVEWDLRTLRPRRLQLMTGNALWCVDINAAGTELAVGTEEGYINIMSIEDDELIYKTLFDKQEGRVLCCKYDASGDYLVTGSVGAIRIWNVHTGHALHKMRVARIGQKEVIVWSLQVLRDFSIISGDSAGYVTIWDGHKAALVEAIKVLNSDVLAVTVNEAENLLMCTGIDPLIRMLAKAEIKREEMVFERWVKFLQRNVHDHDVKSLICMGDRILSGGVDGYLTISSATRMRSDTFKYAPFPQSICANIAKTANQKLLLLRYTDYLELWRLGEVREQENIGVGGVANTTTTNVIIKRKPLPIATMPEKLLILKSANSKLITSAIISPDGNWICYSTQNEIRYFRYIAAANTKTFKAELLRIEDLPEQFVPATHLLFSADSKRFLLLCAATKKLHIFGFFDDDLGLMETIEIGKYIKDNVTHLKISKNGNYIVASGANRTIAVWSLSNGKHYKYDFTLPRYTAATTALALHDGQPRLVVAFADGKIYEYDLEEKCFTCSMHVPNAATSCTRDIILDVKNPNIFILQNDAHMLVLEKTAATTATALSNDAADDDGEDLGEYNLRSSPLKKTARKETKSPTKAESDNVISTLNVKAQFENNHLLQLCRLSSNELVAVGVDPATLIEQLPNAYERKKFGVS